MFKYKKVLRFVNRAVYVISAAMLVAGLVLTVTPRVAFATATDLCANIPGNQGSIPSGMESDGAGNCVCQSGLVETGSGSGITCVAPTATPPDGNGNNGSIWTTEGDCGDDTQDQNHFDIGDVIYINGSGFDVEAYDWEINGQPGHASLDPGDTVASGSVTPGADGTFCFAAYTVQDDDGGEYSVKVGNKGDNYRVDPGTVTVCRVPEYTTETMTVLEWGALQDTDTNDFLVDSTHPCTPPVEYVNVCHVPEYTTEQMTVQEWEALQATDNDDFMVDDTHPCAPPVEYVEVCHVPDTVETEYSTASLTVSDWETHQGTDTNDYEMVQGAPPCEAQVSYCVYDAQTDSYSQGRQYPSLIQEPDFEAEVCPQKVSPVAQCIWNNGDGSVDGVFAYNNPNADTINIAIGADNSLTSTVSSLGGPQPTEFLTGSHSDVFVISFLDTGSVTWLIKSPYFTNGVSASVSAEGTACESDPKEESVVLFLDPYCYAIPGDLMQWTVINPNDANFTVDSWAIDGVPQASGFMLVPGESLLTTTALGTHTVDLYWGLTGHASLEYTIDSCELPDEPTPTPSITPPTTTSTPIVITPTPVPPLPIPVTGAGGEIIPVTGADLLPFGNIWMFAGFGLFGLGMVLTGIRKSLGL